MVTAVNKKGQKQNFSDLAWKMIGKDKGDWTEVTSQAIQNTVPKLPTGEAAKPAKAVQKPAEQKVENKAVNTSTQAIENQTAATTSTENEKPTVSQPVKDDFLEGIDGITAATIKDYFDRDNVNVKYAKKAKLEELQEQLGEHFNWSLDAFQKSFE